jgi:hypothetical protein
MSNNTDGRLPASPNISNAAHRHAHPSLPDAAGSITDPFAASNLPRSAHPALQGGDAGGAVTALEALIAASRQ